MRAGSRTIQTVDELQQRNTQNHSSPKLITTAAICLTLPMQVPKLPKEGMSVTASSSSTMIGDGFVVASSARRQGIPVTLASPLGTGPNSMTVRAALEREGIDQGVQDMVGDTGMAIALIQSDGLMTTVRSPGVEADPLLSDLKKIPLNSGDYVYISGLDLAGANSGPVLTQWIRELPENICLVVSLGGAVETLPLGIAKEVLARANVFTMNRLQGNIMARRLNSADGRHAAWQLLNPEALLVWRMGEQGSIMQDGMENEPLLVRSFLRPRVDTTGVGDTHTGVLIAGLMQGREKTDTILRANYAAAIAVSRFGTAVCPAAAQIDASLAAKGIELEAMIGSYEY